MLNGKTRLTVYVTEDEKWNIKIRSAQVGKSMSDYISELTDLDRKHKLIEKLRQDMLTVKGV